MKFLPKVTKTTIAASLTAAFTLAVFSPLSIAQLAEPNAAGVSLGHTHLLVPDLAKHTEIWTVIGGEEVGGGGVKMFQFPGMYVLLNEMEPGASSPETTANHIGFNIQDFELYKAKMEEIDASIFYENPETGQMLVDLPDGVRVEFQQTEGLNEPIVFHHLHLSALDLESLSAWYIEVFGAELGERRGSPSAVFNDGRVDFFGARGNDPLPSKGGAIDHIGFEVEDMGAFAAKMDAMGIEFDMAPRKIDGTDLSIAFITDPVGTYIEITEGLD